MKKKFSLPQEVKYRPRLEIALIETVDDSINQPSQAGGLGQTWTSTIDDRPERPVGRGLISDITLIAAKRMYRPCKQIGARTDAYMGRSARTHARTQAISVDVMNTFVT
jgi:hypothetical protein